MRVVALTCSNTELVCALGCADLLVGVDDHSDFPADVVAGLPRVGKDLDVDAAAVAALEPDLVLASLTVPGHDKVVARLAQHKLNVLVLAPTGAADVARDALQIGRILGVPERGEALAAELRAALTPPPGPPSGPKVLVEWWPRPCIAAGRRSWVDAMIRCAGGRNALDRDVESTPLEDADAVALAPDVLVLAWCGVPDGKVTVDHALRRSTWAAVPAVRDRRVHVISEAFLGRPGPRLAGGVARLRAAIDAARRE